MKLNSLIFLLFLANFCLGQQYHFNLKINSTLDAPYFPDQDHNNFFNTDNYDCHLRLYSKNDSLTARIFDTNTNLIHYFNVSMEREKLKFQYHFSKKNTNDLSTPKYSFSKLRKRKNYYVLRLTLETSNGDKDVYKLKAIKTENSYFKMFVLSGNIHPFEHTNIQYSEKIKIIESKRISDKGITLYSLKSFEKVNFDIKISEVKLL